MGNCYRRRIILWLCNDNFVFFNRMSITRQETEPSEIDAGNVGLHDWNVTKVSQILLEELSSIIGQITDMLIVKFEERNAIFRDTGEIVVAT